MMPKNRFRLLAAACLVFSLFSADSVFQPSPLRAQRMAEESERLQDLNDAVIARMKSAIGGFLREGSEFSIEQVNVQQQGKTYTVSGKASFFGMPGLDISAAFSSLDVLESVDVQFPPNSALAHSAQQKLSGQVLSNWAPEALRNAMQVNTLRMIFANNAVHTLGLDFSSPPWTFFGQGSLRIEQLRFAFEVEGPRNPSPIVRASITGQAFAGASFAVSGTASNQRDQWVLSGQASGLSVGKLLSAAGISKPAEWPDALWDLGMETGFIRLEPFNRKLALNANSSFGQTEFAISAQPGAPAQFLAGIAPPANFKFARMEPTLGVLDQFGLANTALVLSSADQTTSLNLFNRLGQDIRIGRGLTLLAAYDISALSKELSAFMGQSNLLLRATISNRIADLKLQAALNTNIPFDAQGNVVMKNVNFTIAPNPASFTVSLGGAMDVRLDKDLLTFKANVGVDVTNVELQVEGMMQGAWNNPFGIANGLQISDLGLGFGVSFKTTPIPLPTLAFAGQLKVGNPMQPAFAGDVAVAVDPSNPLNCMIDAGFNKLYLKDIISACTPTIQIPANVRNTVLNLGMDDPRITVVPNPAGLVLFEKSYDPGFLIKGKATIADRYAELLVGIAPTSGIEARAAMSAIRQEPFFAFTGARGAADPSVHLVLRPGAISSSKFAITGKATLLGLSAETDMLINDKGYELFMEGRIFNLFMAKLQTSAGSVNNAADFYVKAEMRNDLFSYIKENASREIDKATKETQSGIRSAQNTLTQKQREVQTLNAEIDRQRRIVQSERDRDCKRLRDAQAAVAAEQNKVNSLQNQINSLNSSISKLKSEIKKKPWKAAENGAKITYYGTQVAGLETAKGSANLALEGAKQTVRLMGDLCKSTPIDADPRIAGLIASRETAIGSMEAAKKVLDGVGFLSVGTLKASKWIVNNGNPLGVVDIQYADFEGKLNAVNGGGVSLRVRGTFAGEPLNTAFAFNFNNPQKTVEDFARSLLK